MKLGLIIFLFLEVTSVYEGIDVSVYQNNVDWKTVAKTQHFVIIRAGYGTQGSLDSKWETNYAGAKAAGLKVGAYWYSYASSVQDAKSEANGFLKALKGKQLEWPVYYDIEENSIFSAGIASDIAKAFCDVMENNKYFCGIYSGASALTYNFNSDVKSRYSIWVAHWGVSRPSYSGDYGVWQYRVGKAGAVKGISTDIDMDYGYVDFESIIKSAGLNGFSEGTPTDPSDTPITPTYKVYIVQPGDNLTVIAQKLGVTVDYLVQVNNIANPNLIYAGDEIYY